MYGRQGLFYFELDLLSVLARGAGLKASCLVDGKLLELLGSCR